MPQMQAQPSRYSVSAKRKEPFLKMVQKWQQAKPGPQEVPTPARQHIRVYDLEKCLSVDRGDSR